ncbi:putative transcription factor Homobox-WOX family [Medicago truncatula]|uniref:Homeobox associated leucine zipper protein n=1 Tax=Medicago truncatula TaxID=3880 RepID=G7JT79_MEDTR|nr:homeobox-leucine zipper protein HAT22 [Medicago truncatula]AES92203.1 homeobox associated leucine zipper protein [Medicago truncatula]RHN64655.1 putative transcription factor Homobox-WOX family [Medicago truncatula]
MESDDECNTGLCLGLGMGATKVKKQKLVNKPVIAPCFDLAFELCSKGEPMNVHNNNKGERINLERHQYYQNVTCSTDSDNNNNNDRRKKLRLTKEQSSMLESTFKLHNTLNPVQKIALADQLSLKTRQIEVWFQNRRARTKLKQIEVDYELLKKHCQNLSDENKRLKKELQELKVVGQFPLCPQRLSSKPVVTHSTLCSSCEQKPLKHNEDQKNNLLIDG